LAFLLLYGLHPLGKKNWSASLVLALSRFDLYGSHSLTTVQGADLSTFKRYVYEAKINKLLHISSGKPKYF